jgi:hypothetical protein
LGLWWNSENWAIAWEGAQSRGLERVRNQINFDVFFKTCPRTSLQVSQNSLFVSLGSKSVQKWCPMGTKIHNKSCKSGLWNPLGIPLPPRCSPGWAQDLKKVPKVIKNRWFLCSCCSCFWTSLLVLCVPIHSGLSCFSLPFHSVWVVFFSSLSLHIPRKWRLTSWVLSGPPCHYRFDIYSPNKACFRGSYLFCIVIRFKNRDFDKDISGARRSVVALNSLDLPRLA